MNVSNTHAVLAATLLSLFAVPVLAADEVPANVTFGGEANMPSLKDAKAHDKFSIALSDGQVITTLNLECKGGTSALGGLVKGNEECAVTGNGTIINPRNPAEKFPRTQYSGGFIVQPNGATDMSKVLVNYLAVGKVPASSGNLTGVIKLKPENPSPTAGMLKETVLKRLRRRPATRGAWWIPGSIRSRCPICSCRPPVLPATRGATGAAAWPSPTSPKAGSWI
jgi:hypothetical protein